MSTFLQISGAIFWANVLFFLAAVAPQVWPRKPRLRLVK